MALIWNIVCLLVSGAIALGYAKFNMILVSRDRGAVYYWQVFSQFGRVWAGLCMQLLRWLFVFLWSLLFIIPGIIAFYSYSMTAYIMIDHPEYGAYEAIMASKEMMRGHKWRLFCLHFSFIGWSLLCCFTCGIGFLILTPYVEAANAAFYMELAHSRT